LLHDMENALELKNKNIKIINFFIEP